MTYGYDWRGMLSNGERRRIAQRGPIDCRNSSEPLDDVVPCRACHCWLIAAFKHARREKHHERRRAKQQALGIRAGGEDGLPRTIWASSPQGTPGMDWLLHALKQMHPERDPNPEIKAGANVA